MHSKYTFYPFIYSQLEINSLAIFIVSALPRLSPDSFPPAGSQ